VSVALELARPELAIASFNGESDQYDAEVFRRAVAGVGRPVSILIDLTRATFIDSTVAGVILEALRDAEATHVGLGVVLPGEGGHAVRRLLQVTGLDRLLPVYETSDAALAAMGISASA
jgi:anti-sigma B factor antagonist